jgi:hypothetical protein
VGITSLGVTEIRANIAVVLGVSGDGPGARVLASATGLGARAPGGPSRHNAVNRAGARVASLAVSQSIASNATVGSSGGNSSGTSLGARLASLGAGAPSSPG